MPKRNNSQYIEIENFEEYELTNCIVYEIVIRNKDFIKLREEIYQQEKEYEKSYKLCLKNDQIEFEKKYKKNIFENLKDFESYLDSDIRYEAEYCKKSRDIQRKLFKNIKKMKKTFGLLIGNKSLEAFELKYHNKRKGKVETNLYGVKHNGKHIGLYEDRGHDIIHGIKSEDDIRESISYTKLITSRPLIKLANTKITNIELNIDLPLSELQAQIKEIKKQYDKDTTLIKTAHEIFKQDDSLYLDEISIKYPRKPKAEKFADWFFIYDLYNVKKRKSRESDLKIFAEIDLQLLEYYNSSKDDYYSSDTYRLTILPLMRSLIDDCQYKQILTKKI